jgi:hypothetical protein
MNASSGIYNELCCYTLSLRDPSFIHQHAVDAFAAQNATESDRPIRLTFALVGLYLHVEKGFTGKQVQRSHMRLGRSRRSWPKFRIPDDRGSITEFDVMQAPAGALRDQMIHQWCFSVWNAFSGSRPQISGLLNEFQIGQ